MSLGLPEKNENIWRGGRKKKGGFGLKKVLKF